MHITQSHACAVAVALSMAVMGCKTTEENAEDIAGRMLVEARQLMAEGRYDAARDTIFALRQQHPTALEARSQAILTLDSVELLQTRDSISRYEAELRAARAAFGQMLPRVNGSTNDAYYVQQRLVRDMEFHFDELCAKAKFYARKIDIDARRDGRAVQP